VSWWENQNELFHRVFTSTSAEPASFTGARQTGIVACVWGLAVIGFEREAWIASMMSGPKAGGVDAYLAKDSRGWSDPMTSRHYAPEGTTAPAPPTLPAVPRVRLRLLSRSPRRILAYGVGAGLSLIVVLLLQQLLLGRSPFGEPGDGGDVWVAAVHCLLAGYVPAALLAALAGAGQMGGGVGTREPRPLREARVGTTLSLVGLLGLLLGFLGPWLTEPDRGSPLVFWTIADWTPEVFWHRLGSLWILVWFAWYAAVVVRISRRLAAMAAEAPADLFEPDAFRPYLRQGLLQSLTAAGGVAFIGLLGLDEGLTWMLLGFGGGGIALVVIAGLLPLLGVRARLAAIQKTEIAWCDTEIAAERVRVRNTTVRDPGRLADLVAYRTAVRDASPWVVDSPAARRFVLYLLIPLLSWVGSALVQEVLQRSMAGR
jgi:hypothetical protein